MSAALLRMGCSDEVRDFVRWYAPLPGCRRQRAVRGRSQRRRLAARARQPRPARLHGRRVLPLHRRPRVRRGAVARRARARRGYLEQLRATAPGAGVPHAPSGARATASCPSRRATRAISRIPSTPTGTTSGRCAGSATRPTSRTRSATRPRRSACASCATRSAQCLYASIEATIADRGIRLRPGLGRVGRLRSRRDRHRARHDRCRAATARRPRSATATTSTSRASGGGAAARSTGTTTPPTRSASSARSCASGRRDDAHELLDFFLADRRPRAWNQWPEISWRDPRSPGHLGDVPHSWIGAEYVLAVLGMLAYESPGDGCARARSGCLRGLARRRWRRGGGPADLVGTARLPAAARRARTRCASTSHPACASRPAASSSGHRSRDRSRAPTGEGLMSFDERGATLRSSARSVRLSF